MQMLQNIQICHVLGSAYLTKQLIYFLRSQIIMHLMWPV